VTCKLPFVAPGFIQRLQKEPRSTSVSGKVRNQHCEQNSLERLAIDSESLVCQVMLTLYLQRVCQRFTSVSFWQIRLSSRSGHVKPWLNPGGPPPKAKYILRSIVNKYREGKAKRTPEGEWNRSWNCVRTRSRSGFIPWRRAFCRTIQRVIY
jgi:hypothetical protein